MTVTHKHGRPVKCPLSKLQLGCCKFPYLYLREHHIVVSCCCYMTASVREIYLLFLKPAKIKGLFKNTIKGSLHPQARKLICRLKKLWLFFNQDSQSRTTFTLCLCKCSTLLSIPIGNVNIVMTNDEYEPIYM